MTRLAAALFVTLVLSALRSLPAESWSQFRGPNASGRVDETSPLPSELGPETNVVWKVALPPGHSSPSLSADRIFLTAVEDERLWTIAVSRRDGAIVWKKEAKQASKEEIHAIGSHAQATPATDGERVVSFFGTVGLVCYDADGNLLWEKPLGPFKNNFGAASSPIIVGDFVVTNQDHDVDSFVTAIDKRTGQTVWKTDRSEFPRGFSSPVIWDNDGQLQVVVTGTLRVAGYDLQNGKEAWTVRGFSRIANMTPVVGDDGTLYVTEWAPGGDEGDRISAEPYETLREKYDKDNSNTLELTELPEGPLQTRFNQIDRDKSGHITPEEYTSMEKIFNTANNIAMAIRPGGTGDITETHVLWQQPRNLPYVPSPVYHDGHLYMVKNSGVLTCVDATTGEIVKQGRIPGGGGNYYSSPIVGDGKLYLVDQLGKLTVLTAEPKWNVLSSADFGEDVFATPAISKGRIYFRTAGHLYCFGTAK